MIAPFPLAFYYKTIPSRSRSDVGRSQDQISAYFKKRVLRPIPTGVTEDFAIRRGLRDSSVLR